MQVRRVRSRRADDGAAAVEFALVVPLLLLLVFGIISYGFMLSFRQTLSQAATEGARAAAVTLISSSKQTAGYQAVDEALDPVGVDCSKGVLTRNNNSAGTCVVSAPTDCANVVVVSGTPTPQCVTVTLIYDYKNNSLVPSFPGVGVVVPDSLRYVATARVS